MHQAIRADVRVYRHMKTDDYYTYFGLREDPFSPACNPRFLYFAPLYKECFYRLLQSIDNRHGIVLVRGAPGFGKTSLAYALLAYSDKRKDYLTRLTSVFAPTISPFGLMEMLIEGFQLESPRRSTSSYVAALQKFLREQDEKVVTVIIDEAQNLKGPHLELLRLLHNIESPERKLWNMVLFAQPEVTRAVRAKPNFLQRISTTFTFSPLSEAEASRLITRRLQVAGLKRGGVFSKGAIREIANYAEGIPRVLVTCCRNAMITAARAREQRVTEEAVQFSIAATTIA